MNGDKIGILAILVCVAGLIGATKIASMINSQDSSFFNYTTITIIILMFVGLIAFLFLVRKIKNQ